MRYDYEDAISRTEVIKIFDEWFATYNIADKKESPKAKIKALSSVINKPKIGHWITKPHLYGVTYCSECDFELKIDNTNYCPNCGAKMESEE